MINSTILKLPNIRKNSFKLLKKIIKKPSTIRENKNILIIMGGLYGKLIGSKIIM
ncbi:MAG: hypothetical protein PUE01_01870 [Clostridiaceae bacterium]|nr:hypothetical protein [Clostridiaceae bacterium]